MVEDLLFLRVLDREQNRIGAQRRELALRDKATGKQQQASKGKVEKPRRSRDKSGLPLCKCCRRSRTRAPQVRPTC